MAETITAPHARATVRYLHVSPYKVRQVLDLIRGRSVEEAERVLELCEKGAAEPVLKLLESAVANAEHNNELPADELYVCRVWCDEGPTRKWGQPRARGRYFRVRKRSSHITVIVARYSDDELEQRRRREEAVGGAARGQAARRSERVRRSRAARAAEQEEHDHDHGHDHAEAAAEAEPVAAEETAADTDVVEAAAEAPADVTAEANAAGEETED